jgi:hypothetical protein
MPAVRRTTRASRITKQDLYDSDRLSDFHIDSSDYSIEAIPVRLPRPPRSPPIPGHAIVDIEVRIPWIPRSKRRKFLAVEVGNGGIEANRRRSGTRIGSKVGTATYHLLLRLASALRVKETRPRVQLALPEAYLPHLSTPRDRWASSNRAETNSL